MLEKLLRSNAEVKVLGVIFSCDGLHLREISRRAGVSYFETRRELHNLVRLGMLKKERKGNCDFFYENHASTLVKPLKELYLKTEGIIPALQKEICKNGKVKYAFIFGSFASGEATERSDMDVLVVLDKPDKKIHDVFFGAQNKFGREINYLTWLTEDLQKKLKSGNGFIKDVLKNKKIWLCGDESEFKRYVEAVGHKGNRKR